MVRLIRRHLIGFAAALMVTSMVVAPAVAQDETPEQTQASSDEKITIEQVENPLSNIVRIPVESQYFFGKGPNDRFDYLLDFAPSFATPLAGRLDLVHRIAGGFRYDAGIGELPDQSGLVDTQYQAFLTPPKVGRTVWAVGPTLVFPTGTDPRLTTDKWSAGPAAAVFRADAPFLYGLLATNIWSFAGNDAREDVNAFRLQTFAFWNLPGGWFVMNNSRIAANWKADQGERWLVPVGLGVGRFVLEDLFPSNIRLEAYYRVERPQFAPPWAVRVRLGLILPRLERW